MMTWRQKVRPARRCPLPRRCRSSWYRGLLAFPVQEGPQQRSDHQHDDEDKRRINDPDNEQWAGALTETGEQMTDHERIAAIDGTAPEHQPTNEHGKDNLADELSDERNEREGQVNHDQNDGDEKPRAHRGRE